MSIYGMIIMGKILIVILEACFFKLRDVHMKYEDENIQLTQKMLSILYNVEINTINYHIKKIYNDNELKEESTIRKFRIVQNE